MSDKTDKVKEVEGLMDELFDSRPKNIKGLKEFYQVPKPAIRNKQETKKVIYENHPNSGGTVVHGDNTIVNNTSAQSYKFDDSAAKFGREIIGHRTIGEQVNPKNMTRKEYEHYLCWKFGFKLGKGWDGVEKHPHNPNWSEDKSHNIETLEDALEFLGIGCNIKAPDGIEKRKSDRRTGQKDIRKNKTERRVSAKGRRQEDLTNNITYFITVITLLTVLMSWGFYSVYLYIEGLK
tara:strand:- start:3390 stop:4094 length:705 start_codon:yes stop_codon:yes gene_type:complete